jgi:NO-binding membrane sensor protein with MHYT domain
MSFLGSLLGLVLATRAREASGRSRARWLALAAVSIGGTGIWLMHLMAMLGFVGCLCTGIGVAAMHYAGMAAMRMAGRITFNHGIVALSVVIAGASPFALLMPISILACVVITALAYATVGFSVHQENEREAELLDQARDVHQAAAMLRPGLARHR